ncbi:branched-chain amino acid ABC transporter permease [Microbacterium sp. Se63.02b]|uniref:branched-chain amino acid ABC transporter permease n=1 Tax=Microbacterium sp. Se63.02b TaxID=2709304 RepID=UPI00191E6A93|nr:branched-chain amino acid ABC transporter permease [Microbacterium sp. Se63.02b]
MTDPQLWLSVLEIGSFFGLIALAYQLTLIGAGFFNFAIGPYAMAAALGASWLTLEIGLPIALSLVLGLVIAVVASGLTELLVVRQVQKRSGRGELPALVAVTAVLFIVQQGAGAIFGRPALPGQVLFSFGPWQIGSAYVSGTAVVLIVATALIFLAVSLWMRHSRTGRLLRAVGDKPRRRRPAGTPGRADPAHRLPARGVDRGRGRAPVRTEDRRGVHQWTVVDTRRLPRARDRRHRAHLGSAARRVCARSDPGVRTVLFRQHGADHDGPADRAAVLRLPPPGPVLDAGADMTTQEMPVNSMIAPAPGARRRAGSRALIVPAVAVAVGAIALVWAGNSGFRQDLLVMVAVYALIALGMYIPFVMAGSMSMAYAAYAAIGAYSVAIVTTETGLPPILGWIIGPLISAAVAVVLGLSPDASTASTSPR